MELQWELIVFTLFVCMSAGTFAIQGLLSFFGRGERVQMSALIVSLISIVIGGIGSFLHLQHWERVFNGFGHLTSGITQELIAIVVFVIVLAVYFVVLRRSDDGKLPRWCGASAVAISIILVVVMSHSYNMAARPAWDTLLLWFFYLCNAALLGSFASMCIASVKDDASATFVAKVSLFSGIAQAIVTIVYGAYFIMAGSTFTSVGYYFDPTQPTKAMADPASIFSGVFAGETALLFWLGAVIVGAIVPLVLGFLVRKKTPGQMMAYAGIGLICALAGGICFRMILYLMGASVFVFY